MEIKYFHQKRVRNILRDVSEDMIRSAEIGHSQYSWRSITSKSFSFSGCTSSGRIIVEPAYGSALYQRIPALSRGSSGKDYALRPPEGALAYCFPSRGSSPFKWGGTPGGKPNDQSAKPIDHSQYFFEDSSKKI